MPENYDRYRRFARKETNPLIDAPVIFLKGMTKGELMAGVGCFIGMVYTSAFSMLLALVFLVLAVIVPLGLKQLRLKLPPNAFGHALWLCGVWNTGLPQSLKRPQKSYFVL